MHTLSHHSFSSVCSCVRRGLMHASTPSQSASTFSAPAWPRLQHLCLWIQPSCLCGHGLVLLFWSHDYSTPRTEYCDHLCVAGHEWPLLLLLLSGSSSGTPLCTSRSRRLWHPISLRALSLGVACCPPSLFRTLPISSFSFPRAAGALSVCHTSTAVVASSASSRSLWRGAVNDQRV